MEFNEVIKRRRMVHAFTAEPLAPGTADRLLRAANRAPSAGFRVTVPPELKMPPPLSADPPVMVTFCSDRAVVERAGSLADKLPGRITGLALTINTYGHVAPEVSREAADRMARALWHDEDQADNDTAGERNRG